MARGSGEARASIDEMLGIRRTPEQKAAQRESFERAQAERQAQAERFEAARAALPPTPRAQLATEAARFWGDQLRYGPELDNGERDFHGQFLRDTAEQYAEQLGKYSDEQIERFEQELARLIEEQIAASEYQGRGYAEISVDYDPDESLIKAAEAAGIYASKLTFSWKTRLSIDSQRGATLSDRTGAEDRPLLRVEG